MAYNKVVLYGDFLDLYRYEKNIASYTRKRGIPKGKTPVSHLGNDGEPRVTSFKKQERRGDNTTRAGMAFRRLVLSNMAESSPPLLVTLTYAKNFQNLRLGYKDLKSFIRAFRNKCGEFRYIAVPEFQKRGALHFHALFWGLPTDIYKQERDSRLVAKLWGRGYVDVFCTDGNEKLAWYLSKYLTKTLVDKRLKDQKSYVCSRNVRRPIVDASSIYTALDYQYGLSVDYSPLQEKKFSTQWFGEGLYRLYKKNT